MRDGGLGGVEQVGVQNWWVKCTVLALYESGKIKLSISIPGLWICPI